MVTKVYKYLYDMIVHPDENSVLPKYCEDGFGGHCKFELLHRM